MMRLSRGENIIVVDAGSTEKTVITSTGGIYPNGLAPLAYTETVSWSSGGVSPSTITGYGFTFINMTGTDPSTSPYTLTMGAPSPGITKTIVLNSTAAYINTIDIDLGGGVGVSGSTTNRYIAFSTLATVPQVVNLVGVSTDLWAVTSVDSTITGGFSAPTGIRALTAARTS